MFHGVKGCTGCSYARRSLAIWSSVLQPGSLSAGRQQGEHDRRRACRINTRAPRDKQNSRMPRWQARTSGRPIASHKSTLCTPSPHGTPALNLLPGNGECGKQSTLSEESKSEERKGAVAAGTV